MSSSVISTEVASQSLFKNNFISFIFLLLKFLSDAGGNVLASNIETILIDTLCLCVGLCIFILFYFVF